MKKSSAPDADPIWVTIDNACRASGLGRTKVYELIQRGILRSTKVGGRRLVSVASIRALGEAQAA
jgi:excisionase family DNA binding protein